MRERRGRASTSRDTSRSQPTGSSSLFRGERCGQAGDVAPEPAAQVQGGLVERLPGDQSPQVEVVASDAALEAPERVFGQVGREGCAACRRRTVHRAASAPLRAARRAWLEGQKPQDVGHGDGRTQLPKIDGRHVVGRKRAGTVTLACHNKKNRRGSVDFPTASLLRRLVRL